MADLDLFKVFCFLFSFIFFPGPQSGLASDELTAEGSGGFRISGQVSDSSGTPVSSVIVRLGNQVGLSADDGSYDFSTRLRKNSFISFSKDGYYNELIPLYLRKSSKRRNLKLETVVMVEKTDGYARLLFGGDVAMGRRFLDPEDQTARGQFPSDNPEALIQASNPRLGSLKIMQGLAEYLDPEFSDFQSVNLESPVLSNPLTPHPVKPYVFFTLPGSVEALRDFGVDYVTLGNNHVYDYLDQGLKDTFDNLSSISLPHSGAGLNSLEAFLPYWTDLSGIPYSFLSFTSVSGSRFSEELTYVASVNKGGAADLRNDDLVYQAISSEAESGRIPIAQLHTGKEYTYQASDYARARMKNAADAGAALVISHHTHIAQGFGIVNNVLTAHGLGNLIFDSDRHETLLGLLVLADLKGDSLVQAQGLPIYIENYQPKPICGDLANRFIRRIGEFSDDSVTVYPYSGRAKIALNDLDLVRSNRQVLLNVRVKKSRFAVVDLRKIASSQESLIQITVNSKSMPAVEIGRDLMLYGEIEDYDLDDLNGEATEWYTKPKSIKVCKRAAHSGHSGICSFRSRKNKTASVLSFRKRVRVMGDALNQPEKNISFLGYLKGRNAGRIKGRVGFRASEGEQQFGSEIIFRVRPGSYRWKKVTADIHMPKDLPPEEILNSLEDNPRAMVLSLRHLPSRRSSAYAYFDDLALISWEKTLDVSGGNKIKAPHGRDFLRVSGPAGKYQLTLVFEKIIPKKD
jgi:poly-gamma-glutamate capsule biosynthesis protein CapA/YwtB (metallophosphatase superfamily)